MEIEYGVSVADKNGETLGNVSKIILDTWTGEPRKYVVRREEPETIFFFLPEHVKEATKEKVKLNLPVGELDQV